MINSFQFSKTTQQLGEKSTKGCCPDRPCILNKQKSPMKTLKTFPNYRRQSCYVPSPECPHSHTRVHKSQRTNHKTAQMYSDNWTELRQEARTNSTNETMWIGFWVGNKSQCFSRYYSGWLCDWVCARSGRDSLVSYTWGLTLVSYTWGLSISFSISMASLHWGRISHCHWH